MKLWNYLKNKMQKNLQQEVCEGNTSMTFEEMIVFAEEFSKELKGFRCCAILCRSEMAASMALLSCFAAGVAALPLSQRYGELHCNKILDAIGPDAVITDQDGDFRIVYIKDSTYVEPDVHPALIMCTSGTTGVPKGAILTETNVMTNVSDIAEYFNIDSSDALLISRPLYHCAVLTGEFLTALVKGTKIRFYSGTFNPAVVLKMLKDYDITAFCGTPTLLSMMARFKRKSDADVLKHICISGECMSMETGLSIAEAFPDAEIYHIYGLTEACPRVAYLPPSKFKENADCVGVPLRSVSLKIISADGGRLVRKNEIGVLWVRGDNVMAGYYKNPQKTNEVLKDGWLCTGDLALFNDEGFLKIKGRNDDLIIKAGMNIYPQEIESALKLDYRVKDVFVRGYTDDKLGVQIELNITGDLEVGKPFMEVRANNKCFSLMSERFRPFITLSCIGTTDEQSNIIAPARMNYQKISDKKYSVTVSTCSPIGKWILLEANLYEPKLIQDTTVESLNPSSNNAFGSSAFIGNTSEYGEQWLYSRPDFDKLSDLDGKKILRAILHLPNHNHNNVDLECFRVSARFCSFGSNWENKISASTYITDSSINSKYQSINLTDLVTDKFGNLTRSDGFIVRTKNKNSGFSVVSTGDSYYAPQILEINFK